MRNPEEDFLGKKFNGKGNAGTPAKQCAEFADDPTVPSLREKADFVTFAEAEFFQT